MIKKERGFPLEIKMAEALLRRIHPKHQKGSKILSQLRKDRAGIKGEEVLDYHLSFLPHDQFLIFNNLRLPSTHSDFFQIDTLLLTPKAAFIIESKNIYGHLFFDAETKQVIRTFDGKKDGFPDPLLQASRQKSQLEKWITKKIPIHTFVSFGSTNTILETHPWNYDIFKMILHAEHIPDHILSKLEDQPKQQLTSLQLRKISEQLLTQHTPEKWSILNHYQISSSDLIQGIRCHQCSHLPMQRVHAKWYCPSCNYTSRSEHKQVIEDHLLHHGSINIQECRQLLLVDSVDVIYRLLTCMDLVVTGKGKSIRYHCNFNSRD